GRTGAVVGSELVAAGAPDDVLVRRPEPGEVERLRGTDVRYDELAGAVVLVQVDREAEVDVLVVHDGRLAVDLGERAVHRRHLVHRADQREADEMGERDLAAAAAPQMVVDDRAVVDQQLRRDRADAGRRRYGEARLHVGDDPRGRALQRPREGWRRCRR